MRKIIALVICAFVVLSFTACSNEKNGSVTATTTSTTTPTTVSVSVENNDDEFPLNAYAHLNDEEKEIYEKIVNAVKNREETIDESTEEYKREIFDNVFYYAVAVDYPEYFYVKAFSESYSNNKEIVKADFRFNYLYSKQEVSSKMSEIKSVIAKIKSQHTNPTDYDLALSAYNYLVDNCEYDDECAKSSEGTQNSQSSTMEGAILKGKAVCTGYSRAYKYMLNELGLKCTVVNTSEHEWNLVMLDGDYYYTDVTWGDTSKNRYAYFNITTKQLKKNHKMPDEELPICTATKDNYYKHSEE